MTRTKQSSDDEQLSALEIYDFLMLMERISSTSDIGVVVIDGRIYITQGHTIEIERVIS